MNQTSRILLLIIMMMLLVIMLPVFVGTGVIGLVEDDEYPDKDDFSAITYLPMDWIGSQIHQLPILLGMGLSIFALFVVYLGGRSKDKRFNDRTLDVINSLSIVISRTALFRAVFNFLLKDTSPQPSNNGMNGFVEQTKIPKIPVIGGINP